MSQKIVLVSPRIVRRCIRCTQPITFDWQEFPVVNNRREMRVVARFYAHPSVEACEAEVARQRELDHGAQPSPADIGLQRAQLLRGLLIEAQEAMLEEMRHE